MDHAPNKTRSTIRLDGTTGAEYGNQGKLALNICNSHDRNN